MSEEELKKLKQEIKREILNEMTRKELVKDNAWKTIRKEFEKMFYSKATMNKRYSSKRKRLPFPVASLFFSDKRFYP